MVDERLPVWSEESQNTRCDYRLRAGATLVFFKLFFSEPTIGDIHPWPSFII
jgi:hypothetical protein